MCKVCRSDAFGPRMKRPLLLLVLLLAPAAQANSVSMSGARWKALQAPDDPELPAAPAPVAAERTVRIERIEDAVRVTATWKLRSWEPGWFDAPLTDGNYHVVRSTWNGQEAATKVEDGVVRVTGFVDGPATVELVIEVPGDPTERPVALRLMPAVKGTVDVVAPDLQAELTGAGVVKTGDGFLTTDEKLSLALKPPSTAPPRGTLAIAHAGLGLTVGDAELRGRARLLWEVRQGSLDSVRFSAANTGRDLDVSGANVASWSRAGDTVTVLLRKPVRDRLDLDVTWSSDVPSGSEASLAVPRVQPLDAFRTDAALQLARDGDVEVVPLLDGWETIPVASLPSWGEGLVEGTATAAFQRSGAPTGQLSLLRLDLVEQPPVMVDVAQFEVTTTDHGRTLTRAMYEVRNERASHLRIVPPDGSTILGVRVSADTALPTTDGRGGWLIPLQRSVETVEGLLSFPVEVILLGSEGSWQAREERQLTLPKVSAPVAVSRTTIYLPPGYRNRLETGEKGRVAGFSEGSGITYGFGVGDVGAAEADAKYHEAVSAWMDNDFDQAQGLLDELEGMGASSDNFRKLQSNLDLVEGKDGDKAAAEVVSRRVKEQARARAQEEERKAEEYRREAQEMASSGRYAEASAYYNAALDINRDIAKLEQTEAVELDARNNELEKALGDLERAIENQVTIEANAYEVALEDVEEEVAQMKERVFQSKATLQLQQELTVEKSKDTSVVVTGASSGSVFDGKKKKAKGKADRADDAPAFAEGGEEFGGGAYTVSFGSNEEPANQPMQLGALGAGDDGYYDFSGVEIAGELISADGAALAGEPLDLPPPPPPPAEPMLIPEPEPMPDMDYDAVVDVYDAVDMMPMAQPESSSRGFRVRMPDVNIRLRTAKKAPPSEPAPDPVAALPRPKATATSLSVVIPQTGEAVRYQQLLIPADQAPEVALDAKRIPPNKLRRELSRQ